VCVYLGVCCGKSVNFFLSGTFTFLKGTNQKPEFFFRKQLFQNKEGYIQNISWYIIKYKDKSKTLIKGIRMFKALHLNKINTATMLS